MPCNMQISYARETLQIFFFLLGHLKESLLAHMLFFTIRSGKKAGLNWFKLDQSWSPASSSYLITSSGPA